MALKSTRQFEAEPTDNTAVAEAEVEVVSTAPTAAGGTVIVSGTRVGALSADHGELLAQARNFKKTIQEMKDAADFSYGAHRHVFKAKDGTIREMSGDRIDLGRWVEVRMLAWGRHYEISPGESGTSASAYVAYSKDGEVIDSVIGEDLRDWVGKPVKEYVAHLRKTEDFDKAAVREFIDTECAVLNSDAEPDFRELVQITLSSSSIPAFKGYQAELEGKARCVAMGLPGYSLPEDPFRFFFIREAAEKNRNTWTKLRISSTLPNKI